MHPTTFIACGLLGLSHLAARLEQEPDFALQHLFYSDATSDEELLSPLVAVDLDSFTYDVYGDLDTVGFPLTFLEEEEQQAERLHARRVEQENIRHQNALRDIRLKYDLQQQKEILTMILTRAAPSLETLVYLPYHELEEYNSDDDMIDIFLAHAPRFVSLRYLTLRFPNSRSAEFPKFPTLTHLHLINPSPSIHTISSLTSSLPSLAYLQLPHDLIASYVYPGYIAHMREFFFGTIPDRYPLAAVLPESLTLLLQPAYLPAPSGFCATSQVDFDQMVERVQKISEAYSNVKLLWPVKRDWEMMPMFPLSRALQEGGWMDEEWVPSTGEWEGDVDGREGEAFWWSQGRI